MATEQINGVRILRSYYEALEVLDYENKGRIFQAIMEYSLDGVIPDFSQSNNEGWLKSLWTLIKPNIDAGLKKSLASTTNGLKGGQTNKYKQKIDPVRQEKIKEDIIPQKQIIVQQKEQFISKNEYNNSIDKWGVKFTDEELKKDLEQLTK